MWSPNCKFSNHSLIDFTDWHHAHSCHEDRPLQQVDTLCKFLSITTDRVVLKIDLNTGRTQDWTAQGFVTCLPRLSVILYYSDSALFKKGCLKAFLNEKVKSPMIKCINQGFRSNGHCQCCWLRCTLLCCYPCVSLEPHTVTHFKLTVLPLQKSLIHIMNTFRKRIECRIQWRMKWTILVIFSK